MEIPLLLQRARGLVKIHGLDAENDEVHKKVWSALVKGRQEDNVPLQYQLVSDTKAVFPERKEKVKRHSVATDEDYIPDGIIKANWVKKHKEAVPSVVVIFFNLEWQAEDWATREEECADLINGIRTAAQGRYTRLVAVLLQANPLADGDPLVEERAVSLRNACQLKTRSSLFALPSQDKSLESMVIRLESAFFELSVKYYEQSEVSVKQQIESLSHATETIITARYLFKCGYFCELRQQRQAALKAYSQMYSTLRDAQGTGVPLAEIKSVAGLVVAKVCQLHFAVQKPKDALLAFRDHMKVFGSKEGRRPLVFRHYAWLAEQQFLFAHVFEQAVLSGISATHVEHPGHYYFRAAEQVRRWKELGAEALAALPAQQAAAVASVAPAQYLGQTSVKLEGLDDEIVKSLSAGDLELLKMALLERDAKHASSIVKLCDSAVARFSDLEILDHKGAKRRVSSRRSLCMINAVRARELYELGDHRAALDAVVNAIDHFRADKWFELLGHTVEFAARAAYEMRDVRIFVLCLLEMSSSGAACLPEPTRTEAHTSLANVLAGRPPAAPKGTSAADEEWAERLTKPEDGGLNLDMGDVRHAVDCKVCVERLSVSADEDVCVYILFHSTLAAPVRLHSIGAKFIGQAQKGEEATDEKVDLKMDDAGVEKDGIELVPGATAIVKAIVMPCAAISEAISCSAVSASLGEGVNAVNMVWTTEKLVGAPVPGFLYGEKGFCVETASKASWALVPSVGQASVTKLASRVAIVLEHKRPALVGEVYTLTIQLKNEEPVEMTNVQVHMAVLENGEPCAVVVPDDGAGDGHTAEATWQMEPLPVGGSIGRGTKLRFGKASRSAVF